MILAPLSSSPWAKLSRSTQDIHETVVTQHERVLSQIGMEARSHAALHELSTNKHASKCQLHAQQPHRWRAGRSLNDEPLHCHN
jgi:hypothetical protein